MRWRHAFDHLCPRCYRQFKRTKLPSTIAADICTITFKGNSRRQQDALFLLDSVHQSQAFLSKAHTKHAFCAAVADGLAVSPHSAHASLAAVKAVARYWQRHLDNPKKSNPMPLSVIAEAVAFSDGRNRGGATTLAMVYRLMDSKQVTIKHVGDSRVYLQRDGCWQCLAKDHTVLNELADKQNDSEWASAYDTLSDWLAIDEMMAICLPTNTTQSVDIQKRDCLLVCTDGIYDLVAHEQWERIDGNSDLTRWLDTLKTQIYQCQGRAYDNGTAVVIRF